MSSFSPIGAGFRMVFRRPALVLRELAWRWTWGATLLALLWFTLREYLRSLTVTDTDLLFLRSGQPYLVGQALADIFHGSAHRLASALLLVTAASTVLWVVLASLGRGVIARRLRLLAGSPAQSVPQATALRTMLLLQTMRALVFLALVAATWGATVALNHLLPDANGLARFALTASIWLALSGAWSFLNWLLSLAALFTGDAPGVAGSFIRGIDLWRARRGAMIAAGFVFGLLHLAALVLLSTVLWIPLAFAQLLPAQPVLAAMGVLVLLYCALVDALLLARLAAYADMAAHDTVAEPFGVAQAA